MQIEIRRGSLLDQHDVDVIVNAANRSMRGGGGIDGAIHRAAGPNLMQELIVAAPSGCKVGQVIVTSGCEMPFKHILHTPGPIWRGGVNGEPEQLASCYLNCLVEAERLGVRSIGFCSISTGVFSYPIRDAAKIAIETVRTTQVDLDLVVFSLFGSEEHAVFSETLKRLDRSS